MPVETAAAPVPVEAVVLAPVPVEAAAADGPALPASDGPALPANLWNLFQKLMTGTKASRKVMSSLYKLAKDGKYAQYQVMARSVRANPEQAELAYIAAAFAE